MLLNNVTSSQTYYEQTDNVDVRRASSTAAVSLPLEDGDDPGWSPRAALQFMHEVVDHEAPGGQEVGVGEVLQAPDVGLAQHLVALELSGLAPVSAGGVDTEA